MSVRVTEASDPSAIADSQVAPLVASQYREENIREYLLAHGGSDDLTITCESGLRTARIEQTENGKKPTIYIPARDFDQPAADFSQKVANRLTQYGLALHEYGHDMYTDGPYLKEKFDRLDFHLPQKESYYWSFVNAIEDHRVETALIQEEGEWARRRLDFTYKNFTRASIEACKNAKSIAWTSALKAASFHYGKGRGQSNILPALLDDSENRVQWRSDTDQHLYNWVVPELKSTMTAAAAKSDPKEAAQIELNFVRGLDEFLAETISPPQDEEQERSVEQSGDDRQNDMGSNKSTPESPSKEDSTDNTADGRKQAGSQQPNEGGREDLDEECSSRTDKTGDEDLEPHSGDSSDQSGQTGQPQEEPKRASGRGNSPADCRGAGGGTAETQSSEESSLSGERDSFTDKSGSDTSKGVAGDKQESEDQGNNSIPGRVPADDRDVTDDEVAAKEHRQIVSEKQKLERDKQVLESELKHLRKAVGGGEGKIEEFKIVTQSGQAGDQRVWQKIKSTSRRLKGPLRSSLQQTQRTTEQRGTRVGKFDSKLGYRLAASDLNVNKRSSKGEQKQYTVIVVIDRSGSMRHQIQDAEVAAGGFVKALEEIGVTVAAIDLYQDTARMVKPFESTTNIAKESLTSGDTGGTTPLTDALILSKERVQRGDHYPFMIVISDGLPNDKESYLNELNSTSFPVIGVNISKSDSRRSDEAFHEYYDICRNACRENLSQTLSEVARQIIF